MTESLTTEQQERYTAANVAVVHCQTGNWIVNSVGHAHVCIGGCLGHTYDGWFGTMQRATDAADAIAARRI